MLLSEDTGYFHPVPGWNLNCAVVGSILAELSLRSRIDTDLDSLFVVDATPTGDRILDSSLAEIADDPVPRSTQYWIEHLAPRAETIIDRTLDRLVHLKVLQHHAGDFWTMSPSAQRTGLLGGDWDGSTGQSAKERISNFIFNNVIPDPRDIIIICLVNTCDVLRFMFSLDEAAETRIRFISNMDLIGRSIAAAVSDSIVAPRLRRSVLSREIPTVSLRWLLRNPHIRDGNLPALFADMTKRYGPVFQLRPPLGKRMIFLGGPEANHWAHRNGRVHLRARDYFSDFEKIYGASGVLPSLDGSDHFRLRRGMHAAYSRGRLAGQLDDLFRHARNHMADWNVGDVFPASSMCRHLINAQISPLSVSVDSQDIIDDLMKYKERALCTHIIGILPKFMLNTPGMKRRAGAIDTLLDRIRSVHTPAQRAGCPRDLADDLLSLNVSDPQLVPESNLRFALTAALIASVYLGDALSYAVYAMASQPDMYARIQQEADALFEGGDPGDEDLAPHNVDVTHRFLMETMRMYPVVPMSVRTVMNSCTVAGHNIPVGERVYIAQTAAHYMEEVFPEPTRFDIDRYLPPRNEHISPGYAPHGLGTHMCLGSRWMELQLTVNLLMLAHYFRIEVSPRNYRLRFSPFPSMKPGGKLKFAITEQRRELPS